MAREPTGRPRGRPPGQAYPHLVTVRLDDAAWERLGVLAEGLGMPTARLARLLLTEAVQQKRGK